MGDCFKFDQIIRVYDHYNSILDLRINKHDKLRTEVLILYLLEFCPSTEFYRLYGFLNVDGYAACLRPPYRLISGHYECHSKHFLIFLIHPYTLILIAKLRLCLQLACVHYLFLCIPSNSSSLVYFTNWLLNYKILACHYSIAWNTNYAV